MSLGGQNQVFSKEKANGYFAGSVVCVDEISKDWEEYWLRGDVGGEQRIAHSSSSFSEIQFSPGFFIRCL